MNESSSKIHPFSSNSPIGTAKFRSCNATSLYIQLTFPDTMNNPFVPSSALIARNGINRRIVRGPKRSQRLVSKSPYTRRPLQKRVIQCFDALSLSSLSLSLCRVFTSFVYETKKRGSTPRPRPRNRI